jgi:hypothetical protein
MHIKTLITSKGLMKIITTNNKLGINTYYISLNKKPLISNCYPHNINYHIIPTQLPYMYRLIINKTTSVDKNDIIFIEQ